MMIGNLNGLPIADLPGLGATGLDIIAWILLPILLAIIVVWVWRLLRVAAGVLSWLILLSLLVFTVTRLVGLIP